MQNFFETSNQAFRIDAPAGCGNMLGFWEWMFAHLAKPEKTDWSLLYLDINQFGKINEARGLQHGDAVLRWISLAVQEETHAPVYRFGGDEFIAVLLDDTPAACSVRACRAFDRLNREAAQLGTTAPVAAFAVLHYAAEMQIEAKDILMHLRKAMLLAMQNYKASFIEFDHEALQQLSDPQVLPLIIDRLIHQVVEFGTLLDETQSMAYTDPVSGLPNLRAAQRALTEMTEKAARTEQPVSVLLIDGDNLSKYNEISYAAGDEMIERLGKVLSSQVRPSDFLARWRVGDEFLVIMPGVGKELALDIAERLRSAVQRNTHEWVLPVTISLGVVSCPQDGCNPKDLLHQADLALARAKNQGKNQAVGAGKK